MTTRSQFLQSLPVVGVGFAAAGQVTLNGNPANAAPSTSPEQVREAVENVVPTIETVSRPRSVGDSLN